MFAGNKPFLFIFAAPVVLLVGVDGTQEWYPSEWDIRSMKKDVALNCMVAYKSALAFPTGLHFKLKHYPTYM